MGPFSIVEGTLWLVSEVEMGFEFPCILVFWPVLHSQNASILKTENQESAALREVDFKCLLSSYRITLELRL